MPLQTSLVKHSYFDRLVLAVSVSIVFVLFLKGYDFSCDISGFHRIFAIPCKVLTLPEHFGTLKPQHFNVAVEVMHNCEVNSKIHVFLNSS